MNLERQQVDDSRSECLDLQRALTAVARIPVEDLPRLLGQLREAEATAMSRLYAASSSKTTALESEQLLDVTQTSKRLNVSEDYLYRNWKNLPFAHKYDWGLRFSSRGIDDYISHKGLVLYTSRNKRAGGCQ